MAKYSLTNKAVEDLSKIWDYTSRCGQKVRRNYHELLIKTCKELSQNPAIGKNDQDSKKAVFIFAGSDIEKCEAKTPRIALDEDASHSFKEVLAGLFHFIQRPNLLTII